MTAPRTPEQQRVLDYLSTPEYPDGWIAPDEIADGAAPDLLLARDVWRLSALLADAEQEHEEADRLVERAWRQRDDETDRAVAAEQRVVELEAERDALFGVIGQAKNSLLEAHARAALRHCQTTPPKEKT